MSAALARIQPSGHRSAGYEVTAWDGSRWQLVGVFDTVDEAKYEARIVLPRRQAVRVAEEQFSEVDGTFRTRIIFSEQREGAPPPPARAAKPPPKAEVKLRAVKPPPAPDAYGRATTALYLGAASLAVSLLGLAVAILR